MRKSTILAVLLVALILAGVSLVARPTAAVGGDERADESTWSPARPTSGRASSLHVDLPSLAGIAEAASPAVVNVATTQTVKAPNLAPFFGFGMMVSPVTPDVAKELGVEAGSGRDDASLFIAAKLS